MRTCGYSECGKSIEHLPTNYKYCCIPHRQKHANDLWCEKNKKPRNCNVCGKPYDWLERNRSHQCSEDCELKQKNKTERKKYYFKTEKKDCTRCGAKIPLVGRNTCTRCYTIEKELTKYKRRFK
ncbi:hypothetical protein PF327_10850 [Sulfurovum sp. XTW-4]|uniref:Uncharacterized protein n=1 Tax=Sulfurovum xiamenensis TaxID=3019066 RepID=A0ABT7QUD9_9BACT|nr:hypothetical protein [Sulfurovum xiamenensis]MDM5264693.1 hypothetical protein [Sulfurovum xiamenensis]